MMTKHDEHLPSLDIGSRDPIARKTWTLLEQAQEETRILSIARAAAHFGGYLRPETPGEYLYWIKDQAQVQQDRGDEEEDRQAALNAYHFAKTLWSYVYQLAEFGIQTVDPTPKKKEGEGH